MGGLKKTVVYVAGNSDGCGRLQTDQGRDRPNCRSLPWTLFAADGASGLIVLELYHVFGLVCCVRNVRCYELILPRGTSWKYLISSVR